MRRRNDTCIGLAVAWARHRGVRVGYLWVRDPRRLALWIGWPPGGYPCAYVDRGEVCP